MKRYVITCEGDSLNLGLCKDKREARKKARQIFIKKFSWTTYDVVNILHIATIREVRER